MTVADTALVDRDHLNELIDVFGEKAIAALVEALLVHLSDAPGRIVALAREGQIAPARALAHGLRGAALNLGCTRVAALAGLIEDENRSPTTLSNDLDAAAMLTIAALTPFCRPGVAPRHSLIH